MIDTMLVEKSVALIGNFTDEEIEKYSPLIESAVYSANALLSADADKQDPRVIQLAAAKAYNAICCTADFAENVTSFTAGDVTIKQDSDFSNSAESLYALALEGCSDLLKADNDEEKEEAIPEAEKIVNDSFAFLGV